MAASLRLGRQGILFGLRLSSTFDRCVLATRPCPQSVRHFFRSPWILGVSPVKVEMPALSPTMEEGSIVKWLKKEGEAVAAGDALCEIETDKAVVTMESNEDGIMAKILMEEGSRNVPLGTLIALMVDEGQDWKQVEMPRVEAAPPAAPVAPPVAPSPVPPPKAATSGPLRLSPAARNILDSHGIDPKLATPTGPRGLITKEDALNLLKTSPVPKAAPAMAAPISAPTSSPTPAAAPLPPGSRPNIPPLSIPGKPGAPGTFTEIPASNVRRVIAQRLTQSKTTIPHAYASVDCDMGAVMHLRKDLAKVFKMKKDITPLSSVHPRSVSEEMPEVNVTWSGDGPRALDSVHIAIAVATDRGLITPIIKDAADKGVQEISANIKAARSCTYTNISNLGMFGISGFSAVINPPQACILAIGTSRSELRLCEDDQTLSTRQLMTVTLSSDGRLVDDELASRFLDKFRGNLEKPQRMALA
ncbi:Pyruvate dehydrogenase protein X component, mitochondrial [Liparis tanakae]|uniref:Dihydrolipoamide acetyltransferase component of pyruvate dehydrogenase complex n=1 Tax=Liparis tanakae TaxID=230148 RepID=A0A4Z2JEZ2_9TELE|nr:Pyruvate dehydrogenase protein X component, mitochondrial [Liparis tanakae]